MIGIICRLLANKIQDDDHPQQNQIDPLIRCGQDVNTILRKLDLPQLPKEPSKMNLQKMASALEVRASNRGVISVCLTKICDHTHHTH